MAFIWILTVLLSVQCVNGETISDPGLLRKLGNLIVEQTQAIQELSKIVTYSRKEVSYLKREVGDLKDENKISKREFSRLQMEVLQMKQQLDMCKNKLFSSHHSALPTKELSLSDEEWRNETKPREKMAIANHKRLLIDSAPSPGIVAFYAYMSANEPLQQHKTLIFDVIKMNYGHGYSNFTGAFTSPVTGLFIFTFTAHPSVNSAASLEFVVNGQVHGKIFTDGSEGWETSAATAVFPVWLNQGDVCNVQTHPTYKSFGFLQNDNLMRCSFAAWKVDNH